MSEYSWQTQYEFALKAQYSDQSDLKKRVMAAERTIYDLVVDYLQGRQCLKLREWHAIKLALYQLRRLKHDASNT